jgi:hypothetical protein
MRGAPLLLVILAGCGSGLTAADFPASFARTICRLQARCVHFAAFEEQRCEADERALYDPDLDKAIKAGRSQFDAGQAQKCLDGLNAAPCERLSPEVRQACLNAVKGTVAPGGQCNWLYECASGLCSPQQPGACPATCIAPVAEGGTCPGKNGAGCDDRAGLRCIASVCSKLHSAGSPCTFDGDCAPAYFCAATGLCAVRGNEQASCGADGECATGLYCQLIDAGGLCRKKVAQGKPCGEDSAHVISVESQCADGLLCKGFSATKTSLTPGVCSTPADVGGACGSGISGCAEGLVCASGKCALPPASGPCAGGTDCLDGVAYCDAAGQCQALKADGTACADKVECRSRFCSAASGKCETMAGACHEP